MQQLCTLAADPAACAIATAARTQVPSFSGAHAETALFVAFRLCIGVGPSPPPSSHYPTHASVPPLPQGRPRSSCVSGTIIFMLTHGLFCSYHSYKIFIFIYLFLLLLFYLFCCIFFLFCIFLSSSFYVFMYLLHLVVLLVC